MRHIQRIEDLQVDRIINYPGLLSCLLYTELDERFQKFVRENWETLHHETNREILIIVADLPVTVAIKHKPPDVDSRMHFMTSWPGIEATNPPPTAKFHVELARAWNINLTDFPCMALFSSVESRDIQVLSFNRDAQEADWVAAFRALSDTCRIEMVKRPAPESVDDLREWRDKALNRIMPSVKRQKLWRQTKKLAARAPVGSMLTAAATGAS